MNAPVPNVMLMMLVLDVNPCACVDACRRAVAAQRVWGDAHSARDELDDEDAPLGAAFRVAQVRLEDCWYFRGSADSGFRFSCHDERSAFGLGLSPGGAVVSVPSRGTSTYETRCQEPSAGSAILSGAWSGCPRSCRPVWTVWHGISPAASAGGHGRTGAAQVAAYRRCRRNMTPSESSADPAKTPCVGVLRTRPPTRGLLPTQERGLSFSGS